MSLLLPKNVRNGRVVFVVRAEIEILEVHVEGDQKVPAQQRVFKTAAESLDKADAATKLLGEVVDFLNANTAHAAAGDVKLA